MTYLILKLTLIYLLIQSLVIILSKKFNFFDYPDNRKKHRQKIINTSGISLYIFLIFVVSEYEFLTKVDKIIVIGFFITLCGFIDDRKKLTPGVKLILLFFPVLYLIFDGYLLIDLGTYPLIGEVFLGKFSFIFTLLACGLLINSFNYIDGIDGLLLSYSILNILYFMLITEDKNLMTFLIIFLIPLSINLFFNMLPIRTNLKMFSGDSGSLFLGFFFSFFIIFLYLDQNIHPSYLIWACWYPVYDSLYVTFKRVFNKKKFYSADRTHLHHTLIKKNKNHFIATSVIILAHLLILSFGYNVVKYINETFSLISFFIFFFFFTFIRTILDKKKVVL